MVLFPSLFLRIRPPSSLNHIPPPHLVYRSARRSMASSALPDTDKAKLIDGTALAKYVLLLSQILCHNTPP